MAAKAEGVLCMGESQASMYGLQSQENEATIVANSGVGEPPRVLCEVEEEGHWFAQPTRVLTSAVEESIFSGLSNSPIGRP